MANKLKKTAKADPENKPSAKKSTVKTSPSDLKTDKEQSVHWKSLARDERTRKIAGTVSLLLAGFFFTAFVS